jgi:hypothetical protein
MSIIFLVYASILGLAVWQENQGLNSLDGHDEGC